MTPKFALFASSLIVAFSSAAVAAVDGNYQIQNLECRYNQEPMAGCDRGETLQVIAETNGDYRIQETSGAKVTRSWLVSERSVSTPSFVLTTFLKVSESSLEYSEDRVTYFPGDSRRQFYQTWITLRETQPGVYLLKVRQSQVRETVSELTSGGVSELSYQLVK